jgi:hypothetical protein
MSSSGKNIIVFKYDNFKRHVEVVRIYITFSFNIFKI